MATEASLEDRNTAIVLAMWEGVIRRGDDGAVMRYIGPDYIQHNVNMESGRDAILRLTALVRDTPADFVPPKVKTVMKTIAQGDLVCVIWEQDQDDPHIPGQTYPGHAFDLFRLENDVIVEHWDDTRKWPKPW